MQVLGTAKNAIVVWIGIVFLSEAVTPLQGGGYGLSLAGFFLYNYLKMQQPTGARCDCSRRCFSASAQLCMLEMRTVGHVAGDAVNAMIAS